MGNWNEEPKPIFSNDIKKICRRYNLDAEDLINKINKKILDKDDLKEVLYDGHPLQDPELLKIVQQLCQMDQNLEEMRAKCVSVSE